MDIYDEEGNPIDSFGNIIHDPWVHEGLKEEEWYAMKAVDEGEARERWEKVDSEYQKYKSANISKDKKYTDLQKIKFNNFKPFGNKIQSFSKKPITLIYGPNSIGKSSLIHLNAYIRYIFETKSFDLSNTDMFGDNINLGGFDKFIHKRDKNNPLKLEFEFDDCSEAILEYLKPDKIDFDYINLLKKFTKNDIIEIINSSHKYTNSGIKSNRSCNNFFKEEYEFFANNDGAFRDLVQYGFDSVNTTSKEYNNPFEETLNEEYKTNTWNISLVRNEGLTCKNTDLNHPISYSPNILLETYYKKNPYHYDIAFEFQSNFLKKPYLNDVNKFSNEEDKNFFISNILIPKYINFAKYMFIGEFKKDGFINEFVNIKNEDIENIAERIIDRIEIEYDIFKFNEKILNTKIPLNISLEVKYSLTLNQIFLKKVEYNIQNTLYDAVDKIEVEHQDGVSFFTAAASYDDYSIFEYNNFVDSDSLTNKGEFGIPPIFQNIPEIYKRHLLFNESDSIGYQKNNSLESRAKSEHAELESKHEAIFLSYKEGYNKLIGAFNDMLNFKMMQYIGPLRFYPERDSTIKELDSDESIIPDSQTSWSLLKNNKDLRDSINTWLTNPKKLKTPYEIKYRKLYDVGSLLHELDFDKFISIQKIVDERNNEIKKLGIHQNMSDDKKYKLIIKMTQEYLNLSNEDEVYKFADNYEIDKQEKYLINLVSFSSIGLKRQYEQVFLEENPFGMFDSKDEMIFEDLRTNTQISNRDLGLGISQVLPVLIATNNNKNMTIAVEQPELHLHPAVQCEIADEFIRSYKENKNEFLIETHSEHLLLRIMKRMRHTAEDKEGRDKTLDLTPDDVCLLYVDADEDSTYIKELRLSKKGKLLDHWPGGFFEEGYKERFQ